jgi:hypothetical protein
MAARRGSYERRQLAVPVQLTWRLQGLRGIAAPLKPSKRGMQGVTHCAMIGIMDDLCQCYPKISPSRDVPSHLLCDGSHFHLKLDVDTIVTKRSRSRHSGPESAPRWPGAQS